MNGERQYSSEKSTQGIAFPYVFIRVRVWEVDMNLIIT